MPGLVQQPEDVPKRCLRRDLLSVLPFQGSTMAVRLSPVSHLAFVQRFPSKQKSTLFSQVLARRGCKAPPWQARGAVQ